MEVSEHAHVGPSLNKEHPLITGDIQEGGAESHPISCGGEGDLSISRKFFYARNSAKLPENWVTLRKRISFEFNFALLCQEN